MLHCTRHHSKAMLRIKHRPARLLQRSCGSRYNSQLASLSFEPETVRHEYPFTSAYPVGSKVINEQHFYQNDILFNWYNKSPHPVSLRQLAFFGRKLTEEKMIGSANFVRTELPTRLAHRIRDLQCLPFSVMRNEHMSQVYELYYQAFNQFRKFPAIKTLEDNDKFCKLVSDLLLDHLTIIPSLVTGGIECAMDQLIEPKRLDDVMSLMLRSRISRRVIAEQHISLSQSFNESLAQGKRETAEKASDYIGEVFLQCSAKDCIRTASAQAETFAVQVISKELYMSPADIVVPEVVVQGEDAKFPYMDSHLKYIMGEILRNAFYATIRRHIVSGKGGNPPPILVSISNTPSDVRIRFSDQGGGVPKEVQPHIWSFAKGPEATSRLDMFKRIPKLAGVPHEVDFAGNLDTKRVISTDTHESSLARFSNRPPNVKLGIGLPMSKVYVEYWDGSLDLTSLEGHGTDVSLRISRLGNQNEKLQLDRV